MIFGAFVGGWLVGVSSWVVLVVESFRAVLHLKPEARRHRYVRWNWFNALPRSEMFTREGIVHRRRAFLALLSFLGAIVACWILGGTMLALCRHGWFTTLEMTVSGNLGDSCRR